MEPEVIWSNDDIELLILASEPQLTVARGRFATGQRPAGRHVHLEHIDMFYVLEGAITLEVGPDAERVVVEAGGSFAIQPGVAHAFLNDSGADATCLNIHAPDGGFADFMRGMRDGVTVEWDYHPAP
jgi:quercetin dioxygenase-like cupin family protein